MVCNVVNFNGMDKIIGQLVYLRPLGLGDVDAYAVWVKDREVVKYSLSKWQKDYSKSQMEDWLSRTIGDESAVNFAIVEKSTDRLIGHAGICQLSKTNNSGEYFILIGDKNVWGKGYGTEVTKLVVEYGFKKLGLHRIMLTVTDLNVGAVRVYTKAGFKTEGIMRDAAYRDGKYHNKIVMGVLEFEFRNDT